MRLVDVGCCFRCSRCPRCPRGCQLALPQTRQTDRRDGKHSTAGQCRPKERHTTDQHERRRQAAIRTQRQFRQRSGHLKPVWARAQHAPGPCRHLAASSLFDLQRLQRPSKTPCPMQRELCLLGITRAAGFSIMRCYIIISLPSTCTRDGCWLSLCSRLRRLWLLLCEPVSQEPPKVCTPLARRLHPANPAKPTPPILPHAPLLLARRSGNGAWTGTSGTCCYWAG